MLDVLKWYRGSSGLTNESYTNLYVAEGTGSITTTTGIKGNSNRLNKIQCRQPPAESCTVVHQCLFKGHPDHPDYSYSRRPDFDMRVKLQGDPDGLFDGPAALKAENMRPHAQGLDFSPSLVNINVTAHMSTERNRQVHNLGHNISHVLTDLVVALQEENKHATKPEVMCPCPGQPGIILGFSLD